MKYESLRRWCDKHKKDWCWMWMFIYHVMALKFIVAASIASVESIQASMVFIITAFLICLPVSNYYNKEYCKCVL